MRPRPTHILAAAGLLAAAWGLPSCHKTDEGAAAPARASLVKTSAGDDMVLVPAGWFEMGSAQGKGDESPPHKVWIDSLLMDAHEVTQEQYGRVVLANPSHFKGPQRPVEQISWAKAAAGQTPAATKARVETGRKLDEVVLEVLGEPLSKPPG